MRKKTAITNIKGKTLGSLEELHLKKKKNKEEKKIKNNYYSIEKKMKTNTRKICLFVYSLNK